MLNGSCVQKRVLTLIPDQCREEEMKEELNFSAHNKEISQYSHSFYWKNIHLCEVQASCETSPKQELIFKERYNKKLLFAAPLRRRGREGEK